MRVKAVSSPLALEGAGAVEELGPVVHVYESGPNQHPGFGELSLMYHTYIHTYMDTYIHT